MEVLEVKVQFNHDKQIFVVVLSLSFFFFLLLLLLLTSMPSEMSFEMRGLVVNLATAWYVTVMLGSLLLFFGRLCCRYGLNGRRCRRIGIQFIGRRAIRTVALGTRRVATRRLHTLFSFGGR